MNIFEYLLQLLMVSYVYTVVTIVVLQLPCITFFCFIKNERLDEYATKVMKVVDGLFMVVTIALLTQTAWGNEPSTFALIVYPAITVLLLLLGYSRNLRELHERNLRQLQGSYEQWIYEAKIERDRPFHNCLMSCQPFAYLGCLFTPAIAANPGSVAILSLTKWIAALPVFGWLLRGWTAFSLFGTGVELFICAVMLISFLRGKHRQPATRMDAPNVEPDREFGPVEEPVALEDTREIAGAVGRRLAKLKG